MKDLSTSSDIDQAARWFAAMRRGVMSLDERDSLHRWRSHPANDSELRRLEAIWRALDGTTGRRPSRSPRPRAALARSAMVVVVVGMVLFGAESLPRLGPPQAWTELDWWSR